MNFMHRLHFLRTPNSIHSGSVPEFYIKPIYPCITDLDYMVCETDVVAFNEDVPILPDDIQQLNEIFDCLPIEPYRSYPGFVRLSFVGKMKI